MPTLNTNFNWGNIKNVDPLLMRRLSESYTSTSQVINTKISKYVTTTDAPSSVTSNQTNKNLEIGDIWVNSNTDTAWIMTSRTTDLLVTWKQIT